MRRSISTKGALNAILATKRHPFKQSIVQSLEKQRKIKAMKRWIKEQTKP